MNEHLRCLCATNDREFPVFWSLDSDTRHSMSENSSIKCTMSFRTNILLFQAWSMKICKPTKARLTACYMLFILFLPSRLPVLGLFDYGPHGIAIHLTYKIGSLKSGSQYAVQSMKLIGLTNADIQAFKLTTFVFITSNFDRITIKHELKSLKLL